MNIEVVFHEFLIDGSLTSRVVLETVIRPVAEFLKLEDEVHMKWSMSVADWPEHHAFPSFVTDRVIDSGVKNHLIECSCMSSRALVPNDLSI